MILVDVDCGQTQTEFSNQLVINFRNGPKSDASVDGLSAELVINLSLYFRMALLKIANRDEPGHGMLSNA
jgi:hypothetical protein